MLHPGRYVFISFDLCGIPLHISNRFSFTTFFFFFFQLKNGRVADDITASDTEDKNIKMGDYVSDAEDCRPFSRRCPICIALDERKKSARQIHRGQKNTIGIQRLLEVKHFGI